MRTAVAAALSCLILVGTCAADAARASIKKQTSIPAQELSAALQAFARDWHVQVVFASEDVSARRSGGASGELTTDEALKQLLRDTGLTYRYLDDKTVTVVPIAAVDASATSEVPPASEPSEARSGQGVTPKESQEPRRFWDRFHLAQADQGNAASDGAIGREDQGQASQKTPVQLEEVVVTAQKRAERLQDVPVPVTALSADVLADNDQVRLQDYYNEIPGVNLQSDGIRGGPALISIRGITTGGVTNPTVGVTIDDVPYGSSISNGGGFITPDLDPSDLKSIEVLRGPQGPLYGASSLGGLLKFVMVDPSTDSVTGRVEAGLSGVSNGDDVGYNVRGAVNVPLGDTFAIRASGFTRRDPGYIDNVALNINGVNQGDAYGGRLSALWKPSPAFSVKLTALLQDNNRDGSSFVVSGLGDLQQSAARGTGWEHRKTDFFSATFQAKLGEVDMTAVSGYSINKLSDSIDYSPTFWSSSYSQPLFGVSGAPFTESNKTDKFSQELRFSGSLGQAMEWMLGGFYTHEQNSYLQWILASNYATGALAGQLFYDSFPTTYTEYAAFTTLTYHFTDRFDVQLGGRESQNKQTYSLLEGGPAAGGSPIFQPEEGSKANSFTYLVTPRLKISPDLMVYARVASGYRPGGPNLGPVPPTYRPDTTTDYELGFKGDILDRMVSFDASVYYITWKSIQLSEVASDGFYFYGNGGRAKSEGVEFSVESRPARGLKLGAWISLDDAALTESFPSTTTVQGAQGDRLPGSSRFSGNISVDQEFSLLSRATGFVGGTVSYVGDRLGEFTTSAMRENYPGYSQTNLHAGIRYNSWTVNLFANNLFDRRGLLSGGLGTEVPADFFYIQPRTVGLSIVASL